LNWQGFSQSPFVLLHFPQASSPFSFPISLDFPWLIDHDQWERGTKVHYFIPSHSLHPFHIPFI
jgi:hypothetical protein